MASTMAENWLFVPPCGSNSNYWFGACEALLFPSFGNGEDDDFFMYISGAQIDSKSPSL